MRKRNDLKLQRLGALAVLALLGLAGCAPKSPGGGGATDKCSRDYNACMNYCDLQEDGHDGSPRAICTGQCGLELIRCKPSRDFRPYLGLSGKKATDSSDALSVH